MTNIIPNTHKCVVFHCDPLQLGWFHFLTEQAEHRFHTPSRDGHHAVKKVVKDKVIDMMRLVHDIQFLCETER